MSYGLCCVTEPRSRTALQLDIFIEIPSYPRGFRSFNYLGGYASGHSLRTGIFLFCVLCLGRLDKESRRADSNRFPAHYELDLGSST